MQKSVAFVCVALALCALQVHAISIVSKNWGISPIEVDGNGYGGVTVQVTFDEPVYIDHGGSLQKVADVASALSVTSGSSYPTFWQDISQAATLNFCSETIHSGMRSNNNGPPNNAMCLKSTENPGVNIMNSFGGLDLNAGKPIDDKTLTFTVCMYGPGNHIQVDKTEQNFVADCSPTISFGQSGTARFKDSAGNPIVIAAQSFSNSEVRTLSCSAEGMQQVLAGVQRVVEAAEAVDSKEEGDQIDMTLATIQMYDSYVGCTRVLEDAMEKQSTTMTVTKGTQCQVPMNSQQWAMDPCCNRTLQYTQCCAAGGQQQITFDKVTGVDTSLLPTKCQSSTFATVASAIAGKLGDIFRQLQTVQLVSQDTLWKENDVFMQTCNSDIYNKQCTSDAECYSGTCETSGSGRCRVEYSSQASAWAKCLVDNFPVESKKVLWSSFGYTGQPATKAQAVTWAEAIIAANATAQDCIGPQSDAYRRKRESYIDPATGDWTNRLTPVNSTGCLLPQGCSYNGGEFATQEKCLTNQNGVTSSHVCAQCDPSGDWCWEAGRDSACYLYGANDATTCQNSAGNWTTSKWHSSHQYCLKEAADKEGCFNEIMCGVAMRTQETGTWATEGSVRSCLNQYSGYCKKSEATEGDCATTLSGYAQHRRFYRADLQMCLLNWVHSASECPAGSTFVSPRHWQDGEFNTQASCTERCNAHVPGVKQDQVTSSQCAAQTRCTKACTGCVQPDIGQGRGRCVFSPDTSGVCAAGLDAFSNGTATLCKKVNADSSQCATDGGTWYECETRNQATCNAGPLQGELECEWRDHTDCWSQAACTATGECDDWDFQKCGTGGCTGSCIFPFWVNQDGHPECPSSWRWSRVGCGNPSITTDTACTAAGGTWKTRALSQSACAAHGQTCDDPSRGDSTNRDSTECSACGGTMKNRYEWTTGSTVTGQMQSLTWKQRQWGAINKVATTFVQDMFWDVTALVVAKRSAMAQLNYFRQKFGMISASMASLSCDCYDIPSNMASFCSSIGSASEDLASCLAAQGAAVTCGGAYVGNVTDNTQITVGVLPAYKVLAAASPLIEQREGFGLMAVGNSATYAIVKNDNDAVVGQVVGDAKVVSGVTGTVNLCIDKNPNIDEDTSSYPVYDFAPYANNKVGPPQGLTITENGLQLCADVTAGTTYYPVLRFTDYTTPTGGSPSGALSLKANLLSLFVAALLAVLFARA